MNVCKPTDDSQIKCRIHCAYCQINVKARSLGHMFCQNKWSKEKKRMRRGGGGGGGGGRGRIK